MRRKFTWIFCALTLTFLLIGCTAAPASQPIESPVLSTETFPPPTKSPQLDTATPTTEPGAPSTTPIPPTVTAAEAPAENTPATAPFELFSPAFGMDKPIPEVYSCHGANLSPPLAWSDPPAGTQSLVLIMDDPDAVPVAGYIWDHWLLFNIPPDTHTLPEGLPDDAELPDGSRHGTNSFKRLGYGGPCPPGDQTHRYGFTLYALNTTLDLDSGATKEQLLAAMEGHILAQTFYAGIYASP